jgi:23S rRNA G2445 N2-methylase RlmL
MVDYGGGESLSRGVHRMKKVVVRTLLTQELEVPEDWDRYDVFDFLAENQSFRTAFQGVSNEDQTARIVDLSVVEEVVEEMGEEAFDE